MQLPSFHTTSAALPWQLFTSDGIPIEPFHLRRERAEGFFDAEGNYVEYKLEPESDAWLDSLGVSICTASVLPVYFLCTAFCISGTAVQYSLSQRAMCGWIAWG